MGDISRSQTFQENYFMTLQELIYKVEELKALSSLYEQTQQSLAQARMLQESLETDADAETVTKVTETVMLLSNRRLKLEHLWLEKTGANDLEAAVTGLEAHIARLQQHQQLRAEQLSLATQLQLELALGTVDTDTRQAVEERLQNMKLRQDTLVRQGEAALPKSRIVTLV